MLYSPALALQGHRFSDFQENMIKAKCFIYKPSDKLG